MISLEPPVADVVRILSARSKGVQAQSSRLAWEVDGLDKLDGLFVETDFVLTPVDKVVAEVLGCVGFSYLEHGNRIEIVAAERKLSAAECPHITVSTSAAAADSPLCTPMARMRSRTLKQPTSSQPSSTIASHGWISSGFVHKSKN